MKNFSDNRRVIEAFVTGALVQYGATMVTESNKVEAKTLKRLVKNKVCQALFDELFVDTLGKVELFFVTGHIPSFYASFQRQVCLDLGELFK